MTADGRTEVTGGLRVGVVLVAYNAASTVRQVLERIPPSFWSHCAGVWLSDDGSADATHQEAQSWQVDHRDFPLTVVRQELNLGYGGNQKAGYRWAIAHQLDAVVLLHGDGQYAPEIIEEIVDPIRRGDADVVLGSRMMDKKGARRGGMPLYKFLGNRILTAMQNKVTGRQLSEWHSGYRAYRVAALQDIDFDANSDGFRFDTEIILQVMATGKWRIAEVPIPTYYGSEISHVNGLRYAREVMTDTISWRLQRAGLGSGTLASVGDNYRVAEFGSAAHQAILARLDDEEPGTILELGCGSGWMADQLEARGHEVIGVDARRADGIGGTMTGFVEADLEKGLPAQVEGAYSFVIAADVIEHLASPLPLMKDIGRVLGPGGRLLVTIPNVSHLYPRLRSMIGMFGYDQRGILDATHLRFFTEKTFARLSRAAGFHVVGVAPLIMDSNPYANPASLSVRRVARSVQRIGLKVAPHLFAYGYFIELAKPIHEPIAVPRTP